MLKPSSVLFGDYAVCPFQYSTSMAAPVCVTSVNRRTVLNAIEGQDE